jgi:hypothetical protein
MLSPDSLVAIRAALEEAGVIFIDENGEAGRQAVEEVAVGDLLAPTSRRTAR